MLMRYLKQLLHGGGHLRSLQPLRPSFFPFRSMLSLLFVLIFFMFHFFQFFFFLLFFFFLFLFRFFFFFFFFSFVFLLRFYTTTGTLSLHPLTRILSIRFNFNNLPW